MLEKATQSHCEIPEHLQNHQGARDFSVTRGCSPVAYYLEVKERGRHWGPQSILPQSLTALWPWPHCGLQTHIKTRGGPKSCLQPLCGLAGINLALPSLSSYHGDISHQVALNLGCLWPSPLGGTKGTTRLPIIGAWPRYKKGEINPR